MKRIRRSLRDRVAGFVEDWSLPRQLAGQSVMADAQAQSQRLIAEARDIAKRLQDQEAQRTIVTAEQILAKARDAAEQEHARMLAELRREVGRLVVQTTTAVVGKVLTPEDERRLAEETARHLAVH